MRGSNSGDGGAGLLRRSAPRIDSSSHRLCALKAQLPIRQGELLSGNLTLNARTCHNRAVTDESG